MCGVAGIVNFTDAGIDRRQLARMVAAIRHRGPDDSGLHIDAPVGLGHARLAIIDPAGGAQPMHHPSAPLTLVFNGEIYNYVELRRELVRKGHRFRTSSDTEVILHLYQDEGVECVHRLNGQWAFALWDAPRGRLFLSRDRLGVRPLFWTRTPDAFLFASEIKALLTHPAVSREPDLRALDQVFTFWFPLPPRTAFRDVRQLPPGHSMTVDDGKVLQWQYWRQRYPGDEGPGDPQAEEALAGQLLDLLADATRIRLRADVPVGAYLSGGLDSTLIASLGRRAAGDRLRTFSIGFAGREFDEGDYQREAAGFLDTAHTSFRCEREDIAAAFGDVVWHMEQPVVRTAPAPLYLLSRLARDSGYKVVLTGEGADEILGGYDIYQETKIRCFCGRAPGSSFRPLLLKRLYPYLDGLRRQPAAYLEKFFQVRPESLAGPFFSHLPRWSLTARAKTFFSGAVRDAAPPGAALEEMESLLPPEYRSWSRFRQAEYLETAFLLPGYILSAQGDRVAMAHGVEARYPFLDHRVVEFAAALPPRLKMRVLEAKHLLKRAAAGLVPERIRRRPKQPYRAPEGASFFAAGGRCTEHLLSAEAVRAGGLFDPGKVAALERKFRRGLATGAADNIALTGIVSAQLLAHRFQACEVRP